MKLHQAKPCPCGSGRPLSECCGPVIAGASQAETAEALMRSRYSAFVLNEAGYLFASWHPVTRPESLELEGATTEWLGLTILHTEAGGSDDEKGRVEFVASYRQEDREGKMHEASRFVREAGRWFYLDGTIQSEKPVKVGRNAPCPCGSGKKYKRCCGNKGF